MHAMFCACENLVRLRHTGVVSEILKFLKASYEKNYLLKREFVE